MVSLEARIAKHVMRLHKIKARQIAEQQRRAYYTAPGPSLLLLHGERQDKRKDTPSRKEAHFHIRSDLEGWMRQEEEEEALAQRRSEETGQEEEEAQRTFFDYLRRQEAEAQRRSEEMRGQEEEAKRRYVEEMRRQEEEETHRRSEEMRRQEEEAQRRSEEMRRREEEESHRRSEEMKRQEEEAQRRSEEMRKQKEAETEAKRREEAQSSSRSKARNHHGFHPYTKPRSRSTGLKNQIKEDADALNQYVLRWSKLQNHTKGVRTLSFSDIPWPIKSRPSPSPPDITKEAVRAFLSSSNIMTDSTKCAYWIKKELLRWHPDKFSTSVLPIVYEDQVEQVGVAVNQVSSILADLLKDARSTSSNDVL